jgi:hypothetical protein
MTDPSHPTPGSTLSATYQVAADDVATAVSTKVVASSATAALAAPLVALASYGIHVAHLSAGLADPLTVISTGVITGGLAFAAGYFRRELARLR